MESTGLSLILSYVTEIASTMFSVGTSLVTWVMDTPLALLGVALFVVVALIGGIRRLLPGV